MMCIMWSVNSKVNSLLHVTCVLLLAVITTTSCNGQYVNQTNTYTSDGPWVLTADPLKLEKITERSPYTINLTLTYAKSEDDSPPVYAATPEAFRFVVKVSMSNQQTVAINDNNQKIEFTWAEITEETNKSLEVIGQVIGYVDLNFVLDILPTNDSSVPLKTIPVLSSYSVTVVRASDTLDNIFTM